MARIENLLSKQPLNERLNEQLLEVSADLKALELQIKPLQEQVARLTKRRESSAAERLAKMTPRARAEVFDGLKGKPPPASPPPCRRDADGRGAGQVLDAHREAACSRRRRRST